MGRSADPQQPGVLTEHGRKNILSHQLPCGWVHIRGSAQEGEDRGRPVTNWFVPPLPPD